MITLPPHLHTATALLPHHTMLSVNISRKLSIWSHFLFFVFRASSPNINSLASYCIRAAKQELSSVSCCQPLRHESHGAEGFWTETGNGTGAGPVLNQSIHWLV